MFLYHCVQRTSLKYLVFHLQSEECITRFMSALSRHSYAAWFVALVATLGSLFFSEVMGFVPCSLCWYQRIFMYPIAVLLTMGVFRNDIHSIRCSFPLVIIGWGFAFYHNLLMWGVIPESASPCRSGVPCSARYIEYFGFVTIPFLSWVAFSLLVLLLFPQRRHNES